jgi:hypothetical protein
VLRAPTLSNSVGEHPGTFRTLGLALACPTHQGFSGIGGNQIRAGDSAVFVLSSKCRETQCQQVAAAGKQ